MESETLVEKAFTEQYPTRRAFRAGPRRRLFLDEIGDMLPRHKHDCSAFYRRRVLPGWRSGFHHGGRAHHRGRTETRDLGRIGAFRDLFHRLNVIRIHVPTFRATGGYPAANAFLTAAGNELDAGQDSQKALALLTQLPGRNVRQLENTCRWLTVVAAGREVVVDLPPELLTDRESAGDSQRPGTNNTSGLG